MSNLSKFSQHYLNPNKQSICNWLDTSEFAKNLLNNIKSLDQFTNNYNELIMSLYNQYVTEQKQLHTTRKQGVPDMNTGSAHFMDVVQEYLQNKGNLVNSNKKSTLELFLKK